MWYELRQHVNWLKAEMEIDRRNVMLADLTDDAELLSVIETRLEQDTSLLKGEFSGAQLAELIGVSQARLARLFRNTTYKSADDYLDFVRLVRAMKLLREHPEYGIVGVSEDAGFKSVRTFQRHMQEAVGMSPVEFRMMLEKKS
jgi:transcriptional regulator GlxA family with amidase domain